MSAHRCLVCNKPLGQSDELQRIEKLEAVLENYREYLREKNEIIKAFAGPTAMTPEDVAYMRERQGRMDAVLREMVRSGDFLEQKWAASVLTTGRG